MTTQLLDQVSEAYEHFSIVALVMHAVLYMLNGHYIKLSVNFSKIIDKQFILWEIEYDNNGP